MHVLFAPDKFKGSLTAPQAADRMAAGWRRAWPECVLATHPVADGGDGTLEVVQSVTGGVRCTTGARQARGKKVDVLWLWDEATGTAWIETALVAGLAALAPDERDPLTATTAGLGDVLHAAIDHGARRIFLGLGGSATNDAGCGLAAAAGYRFLDVQGRPFDPVPANLSRLAAIEKPTAALAVEITGLTDVRNPLLGPQGASRVYGPQKGAAPDDVDQLEAALAHLVEIAARDLGASDPSFSGAGAAGGLGYGVMTFFNGQLRSGFDTIAEMTGLPAAIAAADLVVTGEGRLDPQTSAGKAPAGVARLARAAGKPVIALAGAVPLTKEDGPGFDATLSITRQPMSLEDAMQDAGSLLEEAADRAARLIRLGTLL